MLRYPPMTEGYIFLPRAVRPEVKKYIPRSEVDHLSITTDKEVVFLYNFRFPPPQSFFFVLRTEQKQDIAQYHSLLFSHRYAQGSLSILA